MYSYMKIIIIILFYFILFIYLFFIFIYLFYLFIYLFFFFFLGGGGIFTEYFIFYSYV